VTQAGIVVAANEAIGHGLWAPALAATTLLLERRYVYGRPKIAWKSLNERVAVAA
jgi:hypothetical protein